MSRGQKSTGCENPFVLNWTETMIDMLIDALEKQYDLGKRRGTRFTPEAWANCAPRVQAVYSGEETIPVEKLEKKLDDWRIRWNNWVWVGKQSGVGKDPETGFYSAADPTWAVIFAKRPRVKWCKARVLKYEEQLHKMFDGRSALVEKAASFSTLRDNSTTSNQAFYPSILEHTSESHIDRTHNEFGPLNEEEEISTGNDNGPPLKRIKLSRDALSKQGSSERNSADEMPSDKAKRKQSAGLELAYEMKRWKEHRENEFKQRELARLIPEAQVVRKIKECYANKIEELSYEEYARLILLLRKTHEGFRGYTAPEYYTMMEIGSPKFRDQLVKTWFESIKSGPESRSSPILDTPDKE